MPTAPILCSLRHAELFLPYARDRRLVLKDVTLDIEKGRHFVLVGKNGAGKTTLLRLIHGEAWATGGSIAWLDRDAGDELSTSRISGLAVTSLVSPALQETFQRNAWDITGRELLLTGFDGTNLLYTQTLPERVDRVEALAQSLGAAHLLSRSVRELSQGQTRLLLLGRAMVKEPLILLLDECTDGLDARHRELFGSALEELSQRSTIVLATHRESMLPSWLTGRLYISEGRVSETPFANEEETGGGIGAIGAAVRESGPERTPKNRTVYPGADLDPLVEVENADVYIHGKKVLFGINWRLFEGERWLCEGANGSGKSTFLRMLAGDEQVAWPGKITFHLPKVDDIPLAILRRGVRLVSDMSQALYEYDVTIEDLVLSGFENTVGLYRDFDADECAFAREQLTRVGLGDLANRSIRQISTGQLRRAFLARALCGAPKLLLLDEACTGLDARGRHDYLDVLDRLADEGLSYVFVTHYEEDIPTSVNRRCRMRDGRLET